MATPQVIVVAGPNGAGKSTTAPALLKTTLGVHEFVNADVIAQGLSGFSPQGVALEAGKLMLRRIKRLARERQTFAFETTLSGRSHAPWLRRLKADGYLVHILFLWLASPEQAIARVQDRAALGGHDVPEEVIRRRYQAGMRNFFALYEPIADTWRIYDNSQAGGLKLVASKKAKEDVAIRIPAAWQQFMEAGHG